MEDWAKHLEKFLDTANREILHNTGSVSAQAARIHAESEFERFRGVQDRLFESDFDKAVKTIASTQPKRRNK
jgi:hypothetical protein